MTKKRVFAIKAFDANAVENVKKLASDLKKFQPDAEVAVCVPEQLAAAVAAYEEAGLPVLHLIKALDNYPKRHNAILKAFKEKGEDIWLHVLEDHVVLLADPSKMIQDVETMMNVYDQHIWLGTITDACNMLYSKYCPRVNVVIDKPEYMKLGIEKAVFCSHSNTQWMTFDLMAADDNEMTLDERFTVDMFYIIEFLARRRNTHPGTLYFMNQYCTVASEKGVYKMDKLILDPVDKNDKQIMMQKEDEMFKKMGINFAPDNNVDMVLERLAEQLKKKLAAMSTNV